MDRRQFLIRSAWITAGGVVLATSGTLVNMALKNKKLSFDSDFYNRFKEPDSKYYPFVRWWWNGNILDADELRRELRYMKEAGIGGVEINPIAIPDRDNDMGMKAEATEWLSDKWIDMLKVTFDEAKKLDMTCDLLVGSGWPFGAERLQGDETAQVRLLEAIEIDGPKQYTISEEDLFKLAEPQSTHKVEQKTTELVDLKLVPSPMSSIEQAIDCNSQIGNKILTVDVPAGKHFLYAVVQVNAFAGVINGAPGASGAILNHMNAKAVKDYLYHMSDTIQAKIGPLAPHLRSLFTDSLELEGSNWTTDFREEFQKRRGYDILPIMPFFMFKTGRLGDVWNYEYGVEKTPEFQDQVNRARYDFELTKAEILLDRFCGTYQDWCRDLNVKSRAQAYGRGFFPLETSMGYDIPEGESWTTNWLRHRLGEEMGNEDYRRGRAYTMINKFASSAANLTGKRLVTCEEMTNTYRAFDATLEFLKMGSDMSIISGITHSIWIGVNYSPPNIPFPGWVRYGSYFSEHNNWWPYVNYLNKYRARVSAAVQNATMYTDMAILPAYGDLWSGWGVMTEPFPNMLNVPYMTLLWEAMVKNGNGCDYTSENVLQASKVKKGKMVYGPKEYKAIFLAGVQSIHPETMEKLHEFVSGGGQVFCVETYPNKSLGLRDYQEKNAEVNQWLEKMKAYPDNFILLDIPEDKDYISWFANVQKQYGIEPFLKIEKPDPYFMQNRYQSDDNSEIFFFMNAKLHEPYKTKVTFADEIVKGRYPWIWDANTGEKYRIELTDNSFDIDLGQCDSQMIVFDKTKEGPMWKPVPVTGQNARELEGWNVEFRHSREGWTKEDFMQKPVDLKGTDYETFTGTVVYRTKVQVDDPADTALNLGRVLGVADLKVNGKDCGVRWFGRQTFDLSDCLQAGENEIEVQVTTTLLNYMKTMKENTTAQFWTNRDGGRAQENASMGMLGPVMLYKM